MEDQDRQNCRMCPLTESHANTLKEIKDFVYHGVIRLIELEFYRKPDVDGIIDSSLFLMGAKKLIGNDHPEIFTQEYYED